jgi:hypothetical protein
MQFEPENPLHVSYPFQLLNAPIKGYEIGR